MMKSKKRKQYQIPYKKLVDAEKPPKRKYINYKGEKLPIVFVVKGEVKFRSTILKFYGMSEKMTIARAKNWFHKLKYEEQQFINGWKNEKRKKGK